MRIKIISPSTTASMTREIGEALIACFGDPGLLAAREVATRPALGIVGAVLGEI